MHTIKGIVATVLVAALPLAAHAASEEALAKSKGCLACHSVEKKVIGPAYKDVGAKYKAIKGGDEIMLKSVLTGSVGKWGQIPMPANNVTEAEAKKLVAWILSL